MEITVLGVCGSPVRRGNTEMFLEEALKAAAESAEVRTESILLADRKIADCRHCNWCLAKQESGAFCAVKDDMTDIYPRIVGSDVLLLATPTYAARLSGYLAVFMDRCRPLVLGKHYRKVLTNKIGGAMTVSWMRNAGPETTLLSIVSAYLMWGMIVAVPGDGSCQYGAVGLSSEGGSGKFDRHDRLGILKDELGLAAARSLGKRSVELARLIRLGQAATGPAESSG